MAVRPIVQFAQRRGLTNIGVVIADYAWGHSFREGLEEEAKKAPNLKLNSGVYDGAGDQLHAVPAGYGRRVADRGDGPSAGRTTDTGSGGQFGVKAPVVGAWGPYSLTARSAGASSYGRSFDFKCMATATRAYKTLAKRYLRVFPQNEFFEDDALAGYAYVKIVAEAISRSGPTGRGSPRTSMPTRSTSPDTHGRSDGRRGER